MKGAKCFQKDPICDWILSLILNETTEPLCTHRSRMHAVRANRKQYA